MFVWSTLNIQEANKTSQEVPVYQKESQLWGWFCCRHTLLLETVLVQ